MRSILLIDDHPTFRVGLRLVLGALPDCAPLHEAASQAEAFDRLSGEQRFDLILYDWKLPDGGGVRGLLAVLQLAPDVPVIVISSAEEEAIRLTALQLGATDHLCKSAEPALILERVARALDQAGATRSACRCLDANAVDDAVALTPRQAEVLRHLANGDSNKEISRRLGISSLTVRAHVGRIMAALNAHNRTQAVVAAAGLGLVAKLKGRS